MMELKPCPFCGRKVKLENREFDDYAGNYFTNDYSIIECKSCDISMTAYPKRGYGTTEDQKQELIARWNKRTKGGE